jgi:aminopeptidase N
LRIDPASQSIIGFVDIRLQSLSDSLRVLEFDLIDAFTVEGVSLNGAGRDFQHENHKIMVPLDEPLEKDSLGTVRVYYEGQPPVAKRPPWDGGFVWSGDNSGAPWIGVTCQEEGAKIWWPCKDHPSDEPDSVAINITIPDSLVCASNGLLDSVTIPEPGWKTFHWKTRHPINNYSVTVNIADYVSYRRTYHGTRDMDIVYYVLKEDTSGARQLLAQADSMLTFYATFFGEYPYIDEKFGLAEAPYYGMEHQTINAYGNHYKNTPLGYDFLLLHEMGHEWWGNHLTVGDWADFWIHEGIDIYAEALFIESRYGEKAYHRFFQETVRPRIKNQQPIVPHREATTSEAYTIDVYYKGAMVLHMLRYLIGKEALLSILKEFATSPEFTDPNRVTTQDFIRLVNQRTSQDLGWFFTQYLERAELPVLYAKVQRRSAKTTVTMKWKTAGFVMPVTVAVTTDDGTQLQRVNVTARKQTWDYPVGSTVAIDPSQWLLYEQAGPQRALRRGVQRLLRALVKVLTLGAK